MTTFTDLPIDIQNLISPDDKYLRFKLMNSVDRNRWIKETYGTVCCDKIKSLQEIDLCSPMGNVYVVVGIAEDVRKVVSPLTPPFVDMFSGGFTYSEICLAVKYGTKGLVRVVDPREN